MTKFDKWPDNFFAVDYAPGRAVMEWSDIVACHSGNGTIYQALIHGVPIIGIPTMHDQELNLDRVVALGAGIHLSDLSLQPEHLKQTIQKVLTNKTYRQSAMKQRVILEQFDGPRAGARAIDSFMNA